MVSVIWAMLATGCGHLMGMNHNFSEKLIGFVDVLGFKDMVIAAENGTGRPLSEIREILAELDRTKGKEFFAEYGPEICPATMYVQKGLDFQSTQASDCVIVSSEISPAGAINLIKQCWSAAMMLLTKGVMVRGYIARGKIFHEGTEFFGTGYQNAYDRENNGGVTAFKRTADEKGTPFIEIDPIICDYVAQETDDCVREMFNRFTKSDGEVTAIFPFKRLAHSFVIGGFGMPPFDPDKEKTNNNQVRRMIIDFKNQILSYSDPTNARAAQKVEHYVAALDEQLRGCDHTDETIDALRRPFGRTL